MKKRIGEDDDRRRLSLTFSLVVQKVGLLTLTLQ